MSKLIIAAAAAFVLAGPALAQTADASNIAEAPAQAVNVRASDFSSQADVREVYAKLYQAAQTVCDAGGGQGMPHAMSTDIGCVNRAMADAVRAVNKPALTAMYDNTQGQGGASSFASR